MVVAFYLGQRRLSYKMTFEQRGKGMEGVMWLPRARVLQADVGNRAAGAYMVRVRRALWLAWCSGETRGWRWDERLGGRADHAFYSKRDEKSLKGFQEKTVIYVFKISTQLVCGEETWQSKGRGKEGATAIIQEGEWSVWTKMIDTRWWKMVRLWTHCDSTADRIWGLIGCEIWERRK